MLIGVATSVYRDIDVTDAFARVKSVRRGRSASVPSSIDG